MKPRKTGECSDAFWTKIEPLVPQRERESGREYQRKAGGSRKAMQAHCKPMPPDKFSPPFFIY
jgi:hypothetical protein